LSWANEMKILAVDPGEKRMGLAISDESGTIANPLCVISHTSRSVDAAQVAERASAHEAQMIIVGQSFGDDGNPNKAGVMAARFAEALRQQTSLPVELWDESFTTQDARSAQIVMGVSRKRRSGHLDELAATVLLQSFLDAHAGSLRLP
jgi:putative Holliday junction resolvase